MKKRIQNKILYFFRLKKRIIWYCYRATGLKKNESGMVCVFWYVSNGANQKEAEIELYKMVNDDKSFLHKATYCEIRCFYDWFWKKR